jgi:hypothetical protein
MAVEVHAGEPVTAEAWNDVVFALQEVNRHLRESELLTLAVRVQGDGLEPARARVVAVSADGTQVIEATRPIAARTEHQLSGLHPGKYTLHAEAPGFEPATAEVTLPTLPATAPAGLTLAPRKTFPDLFGLTLRQALDALGKLGVTGHRIFDTLGREVPAGNPGGLLDSPVLLQLPAAGEPFTPGAVARLAVAAAVQTEAAVFVPSLAGLTLDEAKKALAAVGLSLGKVETRRGRPSGGTGTGGTPGTGGTGTGGTGTGGTGGGGRPIGGGLPTDVVTPGGLSNF